MAWVKFISTIECSSRREAINMVEQMETRRIMGNGGLEPMQHVKGVQEKQENEEGETTSSKQGAESEKSTGREQN